MAPPRKAKRGRKRAGAARKTARKAKKAAKRGRKTAKRAAKKRGGKRTTKRAGKKRATKKRATKAAAAATRPRNVALKPRKRDTFSTMDLYDHVSQWNPELPKTQVRQVVDDTLNTVHDAIAKIGKVRLKGIGTIKTKKVPARKGGKLVRNPFTGEMVKQKPKPASKKVKLTAAQDLRKA